MLTAGEPGDFEYEEVAQDSFRHRATRSTGSDLVGPRHRGPVPEARSVHLLNLSTVPPFLRQT